MYLIFPGCKDRFWKFLLEINFGKDTAITHFIVEINCNISMLRISLQIKLLKQCCVEVMRRVCFHET